MEPLAPCWPATVLENPWVRHCLTQPPSRRIARPCRRWPPVTAQRRVAAAVWPARWNSSSTIQTPGCSAIRPTGSMAGCCMTGAGVRRETISASAGRSTPVSGSQRSKRSPGHLCYRSSSPADVCWPRSIPTARGHWGCPRMLSSSPAPPTPTQRCWLRHRAPMTASRCSAPRW